MSKLFSMDNPVWIFLGKLVDMVVLTGLWLVCSLPVITVGASTAALYDVTLKLSENKEGYIFSSFFRSFRDNFKQGTIIGVAALLLGVFLASDLYVYYHMHNRAGTVLFTVFAILTLFYGITLMYLFPLIARCRNDLKHLLVMAFVTAVKNPGWTLLMAVSAICIFALGVFVMAPLLILGVGLTAYIQAKILNFVFKQYHLELV